MKAFSFAHAGAFGQQSWRRGDTSSACHAHCRDGLNTCSTLFGLQRMQPLDSLNLCCEWISNIDLIFLAFKPLAIAITLNQTNPLKEAPF